MNKLRLVFIFAIILIYGFNGYAAGKLEVLENFGSKFSKRLGRIYTKKELNEFSRMYIKNRYLKKIGVKSLKKIENLSPEKLIKLTAEKITERVPKSKDLLLKSNDPLYIIALHKRYGDRFIKELSDAGDIVKRIKPSEFKRISKLGFKAERIDKEEFYSKITDTLKKTGKKGVEITKKIMSFANRHKFSVAAGIALAWFANDPNGFEEALEKTGGTLSDFLSTIATEIAKTGTDAITKSASGVAKGVIGSIKDNLTVGGLGVIAIIVLVLVLLIFKPSFLHLGKRNRKSDNTKSTYHDEDDIDDGLDGFSGGRL